MPDRTRRQPLLEWGEDIAAVIIVLLCVGILALSWRAE